MLHKRLIPANNARSRPATSRHGFTLLEVLIALLVGSIAIAGLLTLQTRAMQFNAEATQRQQALALLHDILERARAAHGSRAADVQAWAADVRRALPTAQTNLETHGTTITAEIAWRSALGDLGGSNDCPTHYSEAWTCLRAHTTLP